MTERYTKNLQEGLDYLSAAIKNGQDNAIYSYLTLTTALSKFKEAKCVVGLLAVVLNAPAINSGISGLVNLPDFGKEASNYLSKIEKGEI